MDSSDFSRIRHFLGKTQLELANLLCVSPKAVQSFEQGWRTIPASAERQLLMVLSLKIPNESIRKPCWEIKGCPSEWKDKCIVWDYKARSLCWLLTGTCCQGVVQRKWGQKIKVCRECEVFQSAFPFILD